MTAFLLVTIVRGAHTDDVSRMQAIELDAGERFRTVGLDSIADGDPPSIDELLAPVRSGTAWVAEDDRAVVVGYVVAAIVDGEGHVAQVSVARCAAGRGLGARLVEAVAAWATENGFRALTLTTFRDVPWNGPYYERLGFVPLDPAGCGPELLAIRARERDQGIEISPRLAMRRLLDAGGARAQARSPRG